MLFVVPNVDVPLSALIVNTQAVPAFFSKLKQLAKKAYIMERKDIYRAI